VVAVLSVALVWHFQTILAVKTFEISDFFQEFALGLCPLAPTMGCSALEPN